MRPIALSLALLALAGCAGTSKVKPSPRPAPIHKTPVAWEKPSLSQRRLQHRLRDGETVVGKTRVEGKLVR